MGVVVTRLRRVIDLDDLYDLFSFYSKAYDECTSSLFERAVFYCRTGRGDEVVSNLLRDGVFGNKHIRCIHVNAPNECSRSSG